MTETPIWTVGMLVSFKPDRRLKRHPSENDVLTITEVVPNAFTSPPSDGVRTDAYRELINAEYFLQAAL